ncbi:MAG: methyltransferase domain-containing protein [Myxococcales bacterium]|nr:MAG: methyltransferase domain-containing protein [Myxococcales bacterium]
MTQKALHSSRSIATHILDRTAKGAYVAPLLNAELRRNALSKADAAFCTELCYGSLRVLPILDTAIKKHVKNLDSLDSFTKAALQIAIFQIYYLDRVPLHAVVNETVALVTRKRGKGLAGLVNAVLRKIGKEHEAHPTEHKNFVVPDWFDRSMTKALGKTRSAIFLNERPLPPALCLRILESDAQTKWIQAIQEAQPKAEVKAGAVCPQAILLRRAGDPRNLPGFDQAAFVVQEEGAQALALLLGAKQGECVLDACAGHGGKTAILAKQVGRSGKVTAVDKHPKKLMEAKSYLQKLQLEWVETKAIDLSRGKGKLETGFDRILIDAPCTALGTIHRRPELLRRCNQNDATRLAELQLAISIQLIPLAKLGATIVFGTCSPSYEEGAQVVAAIEKHFPGLERELTSPDEVKLRADDDGLFRIGPWLSPDYDGPDLYQAVRWKVKSTP